MLLTISELFMSLLKAFCSELIYAKCALFELIVFAMDFRIVRCGVSSCIA